MNAFKIRNRIENVIEIFLIFVLIQGGINLFVYDPLEGVDSRFLDLLGNTVAFVIYATLFIGSGLTLAFAKWRKKKNLKKHALFITYLVMLFTIMLELLLVGLDVAVIDNVVLALMAGWCWLNWKMQIEYIDPVLFHEQVNLLRKEHDEEHSRTTGPSA